MRNKSSFDFDKNDICMCFYWFTLYTENNWSSWNCFTLSKSIEDKKLTVEVVLGFNIKGREI